jgi:hypothetical protein
MSRLPGLNIVSQAARIGSLALICVALMSCGGGEDPAARAAAEQNAQRFLSSDRVFGGCLRFEGSGSPGPVLSVTQLGDLADRTRRTVGLCRVVAARPELVEGALRRPFLPRALLGEGITPTGVAVSGSGRMVAGQAVGVPYSPGGPNAWVYSRNMERATANSTPVRGYQREFLYVSPGSSDAYWHANQRTRCAIISGDAAGASELIPAFVLGLGAAPVPGAPLTDPNQREAAQVVDWMRIGRQPADSIAFWQALSPSARATVERVMRDAPGLWNLRYRDSSETWWRARPAAQVNWGRNEYLSCAAWYPELEARVGPPPTYALDQFQLN